MDRIQIKNAYDVTCRLASEAGAPRPNFVEWGRVYKTPNGSFRIVSEFQDTGRNTYEDDNGRIRKLPKGHTFHTSISFLERVG